MRFIEWCLRAYFAVMIAALTVAVVTGYGWLVSVLA